MNTRGIIPALFRYVPGELFPTPRTLQSFYIIVGTNTYVEVVVVYLGFLTTFSLVGRDSFSFQHMAMIVSKIFYGSSFVGFDVMYQIDPVFGKIEHAAS